MEYRDYYYHYYYYVQSINNKSVTLQYSFSCSSSEIYCNFVVSYTACNLNFLSLLLCLLNKANLNGKQLNCLVSQPIENRPLIGCEVTVWKHRSAKPMKVYPASRVLTFSPFVFS